MDLNKHTKKELISLLKSQGKRLYLSMRFNKAYSKLCHAMLNDWKRSDQIWAIIYFMGIIVGTLLGLGIGGAF